MANRSQLSLLVNGNTTLNVINETNVLILYQLKEVSKCTMPQICTDSANMSYLVALLLLIFMSSDPYYKFAESSIKRGKFEILVISSLLSSDLCAINTEEIKVSRVFNHHVFLDW